MDKLDEYWAGTLSDKDKEFITKKFQQECQFCMERKQQPFPHCIPTCASRRSE